jgi:hypothetical protein
MTGKILSIGEALVDLIPERTAPLSVADRFDRRPLREYISVFGVQLIQLVLSMHFTLKTRSTNT